MRDVLSWDSIFSPPFDHLGINEMHEYQSEEIINFLKSNMKDPSNSNVHLTGHSLGGGLVLLLARDIEKAFLLPNSTGSVFNVCKTMLPIASRRNSSQKRKLRSYSEI